MTTSRIATDTARVLFAAVLATSLSAVAHGQGVRETYETHNRAAMAARTAGDWVTVRRHASAVDTLFNGNPATLMAVARASARMGDTAAALNTVRTVVAMGLVRNLTGDEDLASLRSHAEWSGLVAKNEENAKPVGEPRTLFALPSLDFLAEDIVWDGARDRYLVSSVRKGSIVSVGRDGKLTQLVGRGTAGSWGFFALGIDSARGRLWSTTVAMPHLEGFSAADSGKSAVIRFDLSTGSIQKRYDLPATKRGNSPGDVAIAKNGDVFISDSRSGIVYTIRAAVDSLEILVGEGTFMSPQGPAVSADGKALFVADYIRGLARVDLATRAVSWLAHERAIALSGIDGLTVAGPNHLIAVQNGVMPNRVVALTLDESGKIVRASVLAQNASTIREPTHGLIAGGEFHFIANSGWDGFDDNGALKKEHNLFPPSVLSVRLKF